MQWFHVPIIYKHMQASDGSDEREASADVFFRRPERVKVGRSSFFITQNLTLGMG